jgi:hypothetical protein
MKIFPAVILNGGVKWHNNSFMCDGKDYYSQAYRDRTCHCKKILSCTKKGVKRKPSHTFVQKTILSAECDTLRMRFVIRLHTYFFLQHKMKFLSHDFWYVSHKCWAKGGKINHNHEQLRLDCFLSDRNPFDKLFMRTSW